MKWIKYILFVVFLPATAKAQTAHLEDERIVYKGEVAIASAGHDELFQRAKDAIQNVRVGKERIVEENKEKGKITAKGTIRLVTPQHLIRTVEYIFELSVDEGKYKYRIDSVYLKQKERGGSTIAIPSQRLVKGVGETGIEAIEAEKQLNEIDMNFQKLLALVNTDMKKATVAKND